MLRHCLIGFLCIGLVACSSMGQSVADQEKPIEGLSEADKVYGLSMFWKEVSYNFAHWETAGDLDWDAAYQEALSRVLATQNDYEYFRELQRFCALLKDGHTNVWMPKIGRAHV